MIDGADVVDADVLAHLDPAGLGVDLHRAQVGAVREAERHRVEGRLRVEVGLEVLREVVRGERRQRDLRDAHALVGAGDAEAAVVELDVVDVGLHQVRRDDLGLLDHLVGGPDDRLTAEHERPGAVGVQAPGGDLGVAVQHLDVLERYAEPVGHDLAEGRLVALPVRTHPDDHLDLAGREHPDLGVLPATGAVRQLAEDPAGRQAAHLGVRRDADAELDPVAALAALLLLGPQRVVPERLLGLRRGGLVVAGVVLRGRRPCRTGTRRS